MKKYDVIIKLYNTRGINYRTIKALSKETNCKGIAMLADAGTVTTITPTKSTAHKIISTSCYFGQDCVN